MTIEQIPSPAERLRLERIVTLRLALQDALPAEAAAVCAAFLDEVQAGAPAYDPFEDLRGAANLWAASAHDPELLEYFCASGAEIRARGLAGGQLRRACVAAVNALGPADRRAVIARLRRPAA